MKKIIKALCAAAVICIAIIFASCSNEAKQDTSVITETSNVTTQNESKPLEGVAFESFECSGYYVCLDKDNIVDQNGTEFSFSSNNAHEGADSYSLYAETENGTTLIFNTDYYGGVSNYAPQICAYIDDSLYFTFVDNLYRIQLQTDETGAIISCDIYLVKEGGCFVPVKVQTDTLILSNDNSYLALNTKSGETTDSFETDMSVSAD